MTQDSDIWSKFKTNALGTENGVGETGYLQQRAFNVGWVRPGKDTGFGRMPDPQMTESSEGYPQTHACQGKPHVIDLFERWKLSISSQ